MKKLHDYVVKATLTQRHYLIELLQAALPQYITKLVNWQQVSMLSETLSEPSGEPSKPPGPLQRPIYADMAVRLPLLDPASVCICVVIEIKSAYTHSTGLQLDRYSHAMLRRYRDCSYIIRLLFHSGRRPLPIASQVIPESLAPASRLLFPFDTVIADVHSEQLLQRLHSTGMRALVATARDMWRLSTEAEYWAHVRKWIMPLFEVDEDQYGLLVWYSMQMIQRRKIHIDHDRVLEHTKDKEGTDMYMTIAKQLREEGHAKGRTEGLLEGRTEGLTEGRTKGRTEGLVEGHTKGLLEGRAEAARRLLIRGFDNGMVHEITGLPIADIEQLRNGSERGGD